MTTDVFVSYSREDQEAALQLVCLLEQCGGSVWIDQKKLEPAAFWPSEIVAGVRNCRVLILLISEESVVSDNVLREVSLALEYKKPILPLLLQPTEIPPKLQFQLAGIQRLIIYQGDLDENLPDIARGLRRFDIRLNLADADLSAMGSSDRDFCTKPKTAATEAAERTIQDEIGVAANYLADTWDAETDHDLELPQLIPAMLDYTNMTAVLEEPKTRQCELNDLSDEIEAAVDQEEYQGLLLKVERLLEITPNDQEMKRLACRIERLEEKRDRLFAQAKQCFLKSDYESTIRRLDEIHPSLQDEEVTKLRQDAQVILNEIKIVCASMRLSLVEEDDGEFFQALEKLWALLPETARGAASCLPAEVEKQLGFQSSAKSSTTLLHQLSAKTDQYLKRRGQNSQSKVFAKRLADWKAAEAIWTSAYAVARDDFDIGVWSNVDEFLRLRDNDEDAARRVDELYGRRGWEIYRFDGHHCGVYAVWFAADGRSVFSRDHENTLCQWSLETGQKLPLAARKKSGRHRTWYSSDGAVGLSISDHKNVSLWNAATGEEVCELVGHTKRVQELAVSPENRYVATGSDDKTVRLWDARSGQQVQQFEGHRAPVHSVTFSPDIKSVVSSAHDSTIRLWDIESGRQQHELPSATDVARSLMFSPDGQSLSWIGEGGTILLSNTHRGERVFELGRRINSATFSHDGRRVLGACEDNTIKIWDADSGSEEKCLRGHRYSVTSIVNSPDGRRALSGSEDETLRLWDIATGQQLRCFAGHKMKWWHRLFRSPANINCTAISPNGQYAVSGSDDRTVRVWYVGL